MKTLLWRTESTEQPEENHSRPEADSIALIPNQDDVRLLRKILKRSTTLDPNQNGGHTEKLEKGLKQLIAGQDEAIHQIVNMYQMYLAGLNAPGRPVGNLLFLGPTGSGKTRIVEAVAEVLLHNPRALIRVDCAEFQHSHEIAKLIGSPPGYLGHRETHPLFSQEALQQHHTDQCKLSLILFDEIEKASDALWNLLLGILDKASLTLGDNRRVDFSQTLIFMTSNLGAREMENMTHQRLGFLSSAQQQDNTETRKLEKTGLSAARKRFTPEFMNRLDKVVVFRQLSPEHLQQVLELELHQIQERILNGTSGCPFIFTATPELKTHLLQQGTDARYGARHLKRAIEKLIVQPLSSLIITDQIRHGDWIRMDYCNQQVTFSREAEDLPLRTMNTLVSADPHPPEMMLPISGNYPGPY